MKKIMVTTGREDLEKMKAVLKDTLYFVTKEDDFIKVSIYIHDEELDGLISELENTIDFRYREHLIEVFTPEFIISSVLTRSEEKVEEAKEKTPVEKLIDSTKPHLRLDTSKIALTSIAGMIALTGLFMDNVAIIIGAMLLSPLLGPIYAFAINTAVGKAKDVFRAIVNLSVLLFMVIVFSFLTTALISRVSDLSLTSEILSRMESNFIYIFMALLLGFASVCALTKEISESIAGVAIAAALLPPAVVTGISLVLYPARSVNAFMLTLENVLGLMAGSLAATLLLNIGPRRYYEKRAARQFIARASLVLVVLLLLLLVLSLML